MEGGVMRKNPTSQSKGNAAIKARSIPSPVNRGGKQGSIKTALSNDASRQDEQPGSNQSTPPLREALLLHAGVELRRLLEYQHLQLLLRQLVELHLVGERLLADRLIIRIVVHSL